MLLIVEFFIILVLVLVLDFTWITLNSSIYNKQIESVQKSKLDINIFGAISSYFLFLLLYFII